MKHHDHFIHYGTLYAYRLEHETPKQAIEAGAVYEIQKVQGYSEFHDAAEVICNLSDAMGEKHRVGMFIEVSDGSLLTFQDVYLLEKRLKT